MYANLPTRLSLEGEERDVAEKLELLDLLRIADCICEYRVLLI
jgi:hypothetical protein